MYFLKCPCVLGLHCSSNSGSSEGMPRTQCVLVQGIYIYIYLLSCACSTLRNTIIEQGSRFFMSGRLLAFLIVIDFNCGWSTGREEMGEHWYDTPPQYSRLLLILRPIYPNNIHPTSPKGSINGMSFLLGLLGEQMDRLITRTMSRFMRGYRRTRLCVTTTD